MGRRVLAFGLVIALSPALSTQPAAAGSVYTAVASGDWTDAATWQGGVIAPPMIGRSDLVEIYAGVTVTISPATTINDAGTILNRGTLIVGGALNVQKFLSNAPFSRLTVNAGGTMNVSGTDLPVILQNTGTTLINHGTLAFGPGGELTNQNGSRLESDGSFVVSGNASINNFDVSEIVNDVGGSIDNLSANFLNQGQIMNSGSFTNELGAKIQNYVGFTNNPGGSITNHGTFWVNAGAVANFGTVTNDAVLTVFSRFLNIQATLTNLAGGTITAQGGGSMTNEFATIANSYGASFVVLGGTLLNTANGKFQNHGLLATQAGSTLTNDGNGVITNYADGTITNDRNSVFENGDASQGGGTLNSFGPLTNAGRLDDTFGGVHLFGPAAMTNSGAITISGSFSSFIVDSGASLTNTGSITNASTLTNLGTIQNHGKIDNVDPGFLNNGGSVVNYCADGAVVTGRAVGNAVQGVGCTTTFNQTGIPSATWGVTANGTRYSGSGSSIGVDVPMGGIVTYGYDATIITAGTRYDCFGCAGSTTAGRSANANYFTSYLVTYQAIGCALPVPTPSAQWIQAGYAPTGGFPGYVASNDDPTTTQCIFQGDDRPSNTTGPTTVTGTYATQYLLTVNNGASGSQTYYDAGTPITLTADVVPSQIFIQWQLDGTLYPRSVKTITFTMNGPHTATAIYAISPQAMTQLLLDTVNGMGLGAGRTQSLDAKLSAAIAAIGRGSNSAALGQLKAFVDEVRAQTGKGITVAQAGSLTSAAADIIAVLSSPR